MEFSFMWWIENVSYYPRDRREVLNSPHFTPGGLNDTSWVLSLHPYSPFGGVFDFLKLKRSSHDAGPESILLKIEISVMKIDGSILSSDGCENTFRKGQERMFRCLLFETRSRARRKTEYLPGDTLGVRCRMWMSGEGARMVGRCTARTRIGIGKISFIHTVENFSSLKLGEKKILQIPSHSETGYFFTSTLRLVKNDFNEDAIKVKTSSSNINYKLYIQRISVINASGNIIECFVCKNLKRMFLLQKREKYLPNDELSLLCECTFGTGVIHREIEEAVHDLPVTVFEQRYNIPHSKNDAKAAEKLFTCPSSLDDFKTFYNDRFLTDIVLKTPTKSFPAHKIVLCARSSVFRAMLTNDMKEKNTDCIQVEDLENETVQHLLLFLYSESLEELQWDLPFNSTTRQANIQLKN
ncbi:unnamed protein product [Larinioides sclopetarius]|uniref:BTB domain-containing protein n=1 Tax=Larinioides sclopetarius TaxID=280406 RepID=A0AAV2AD11_9ARAC